MVPLFYDSLTCAPTVCGALGSLEAPDFSGSHPPWVDADAARKPSDISRLGFIVTARQLSASEDAVNRTDDLPPQVMHALKAGRKVEAIKRLRESRGMGLAEAKDAVEAALLADPHPIRTHRAAAKNDSGMGRLIVVFVVLGACVAAYLFVSGSG